MKEILRAKSKTPTEKECYEELVKSDTNILLSVGNTGRNRIFSEVAENILMQLSEYAPSPEEPGKYPAYKELLRKANEFVREPAEDPSRVMMQRAGLKSALEDAEKAGGLRSRPRRPRTQEKPEKQAK